MFALCRLPRGRMPRLPLALLSLLALAGGHARADGTWSDANDFALGVGCNGEVSALVHAPDGRVVVGGRFSQCGAVPARNIAVFDPQSDSWASLGPASSNGVNSQVLALAFHEGDLYVGGMFTEVSDTDGSRSAKGFARWSESSWSAPVLAGFQVQWITALQSAPEGLYVGGNLHQQTAEGTYHSGVFRWNGSTLASFHSDSSIGTGSVSALALFNGDLVAAGLLAFSVQGHSPFSGPQLARWTGSAWEALGRPGGGGINGYVRALEVHEGALFVGGRFLAVDTFGAATGVPGIAAQNIARWDGSTWSALDGGTNARVEAMTSTPDGLLVGGRFSQAGMQPHAGLVRWDGNAWVSAPDLGNDGQTRVLALASSGTEVSIGGSFGWRQSGEQMPVVLNHVAQLSGDAWLPMGSSAAGGANHRVTALVVHQGELFAGGVFTSIGGTPANRIARHDGLRWEPLGDSHGNGVNGPVLALLSRPDGLYLGGDFTAAHPGSATETPLRGLARWNGTRIEPPGPGVGVGLSGGERGIVSLLAEDRGALLVAGTFSQTEANGNSVPSSGLARFAQGVWTEVTAADQPVKSLVRSVLQTPEGLMFGGDVFARVYDPDIDEWVATAAGVARAGASGWEALASPGGYGLGPASSTQADVYPQVFALQIFGGELYAGGRFSLADAGSSNEVAVSNIARWTGSRWLPLGGPGQGPDGVVLGLYILGDKLAVLGNFQRIRTGSSSFLSANGIALFDASGWSAPAELSIGAGSVFDQAEVLLPWNDDLLIGGQFGQQGERAASHFVWTLAPLFSSGFESGTGTD